MDDHIEEAVLVEYDAIHDVRRAPSGSGFSLGVFLSLVLVLILGGALRLWRIDAPPTDFPADRQINTAVLIESWTQGRALDDFRFLHQDQIKGPRVLMPEAPILPALTALTVNRFSKAPLVNACSPFTIARLWAVAFSMITALGIFELGRRWFGARTGLLAVGAYALIPASIYFGRAVIADGPMTTFMVLAMLATDAFSRRLSRNQEAFDLGAAYWMIVALAMVVLATLAKIYGALIVVPMILMTARHGLVALKRLWGWFALLIVAVIGPLMIYYGVSPLHPLRDLTALSAGTNSLFDTLSQYRFGTKRLWFSIFLNRIDLMLTAGGAILALMGWVLTLWRRGAFGLGAWAAVAGGFAYGAVGANTYWMVLLLPPACLCMGVTLDAVALRATEWGDSARWGRWLSGWGVAAAVWIACLLWSPAANKIYRSYYAPEMPAESAGAFARSHTQPGDDLAACGQVPFDLLWASGRAGLSIRPDEDWFLKQEHLPEWDVAAVMNPAPNRAFNALFDALPLVTSIPECALFKMRTTDTLVAPFNPAGEELTRLDTPIVFQNGLELTAFSVTTSENDGDRRPESITLALVVALPQGARGLAHTFLAARWLSPGHSEPIGRMPVPVHGINLPGESFSRCQTRPVSLAFDPPWPLPPPEERLTRPLHYRLIRARFEVPLHWPSGEARLQVALGINDGNRWEWIPWQDGEGHWTDVTRIQIPPRADAGLGRIHPTELFAPERPNGQSGVEWTADMQIIYADLGRSTTSRTLQIAGAAWPASGEIIALNVNGQRQDILQGEFKRTWNLPPTPNGATATIRVEDPALDPNRSRGARWPLYLDEYPLFPGHLVIETIRVTADNDED